MNNDIINQGCPLADSSKIKSLLREKIHQLLSKINELSVDEKSQILDIQKFPLDLPEQLSKEFLEYLKSIYIEIKGSEADLDKLTDSQLKYLEYAVKYKADSDTAYEDAKRRTLWERITNNNHPDIIQYLQCQHRYAEYLLRALAKDFLEDVVDDDTFIL